MPILTPSEPPISWAPHHASHTGKRKAKHSHLSGSCLLSPDGPCGSKVAPKLGEMKERERGFQLGISSTFQTKDFTKHEIAQTGGADDRWTPGDPTTKTVTKFRHLTVSMGCSCLIAHINRH